MNKKYLPIILIIILIVVGGAYLLFGHKNLNVSNDSNTVTKTGTSSEETTSGTPSISNRNEFSDVSRLKVGDTIGGFTIASIAPHSIGYGPVSNTNVDIVFTGEVSIEGTVYMNEITGPTLMPADSFKSTLPCGSISSRGVGCFGATITNAGEFGLDTISFRDPGIKIKGIVTKYTYIAYPSEGAPTITLTNVVKE